MAIGLSHFNPKPSFWFNKKPTLEHMHARYEARAMAVAQDQSYWASIEAEIEAHLKNAIPIRPPESVFEPMHHLTFTAPRTTASALCVAACDLIGGDRSQTIIAAAAIHLMHVAAYIHEHLPLTDRPNPRPTIQHKYGPNIELLTGDGIIPLGLELLAESMDSARTSPDKILRVILEITRAIGSQGMIDGQYNESLRSGQHEIMIDIEHIEHVCRKKEGELHACGAACGAILGGGAEEDVEKLRKFGLYAGMVKGMEMAKGNPIIEAKIERLKELALKELESFKGKKSQLELISSLVEPIEPLRREMSII